MSAAADPRQASFGDALLGKSIDRRAFLRGILAAGLAASFGCSRPEQDIGLIGVRPYKYGNASSQIGELTVPNRLGPHPVVVLLHGGWWRVADFDRRAMRSLAEDISDRGFAAWNLEYRLVGEPGGGWPGTFEDVSKGIDALVEHAASENLDLERVVIVGHSSGGHLALWCANRTRLPAGAPGYGPKVRPRGIIALNAISDLASAASQNLGDGAVVKLLGGTPAEVPDRYALASPIQLLPLPVPQLLFHATADPVVPVEQSRRYVQAAKSAGSDARLVELPDKTHFDVIDPETDSWRRVVDAIRTLVGW